MANPLKYKSISLPIAAYRKLKAHCHLIADFDGVPLSISQTIQHHILLADDYLNERKLPKDCYHLRTKPFVNNQSPTGDGTWEAEATNGKPVWKVKDNKHANSN